MHEQSGTALRPPAHPGLVRHHEAGAAPVLFSPPTGGREWVKRGQKTIQSSSLETPKSGVFFSRCAQAALMLFLWAQAASGEPGTPSPIWAGSSGGYLVRWTTGDIAARKPGSTSEAFSLHKQTRQQFAERDGAENEGCEGSREARLLSVVGPFVSFEQSDEGYCPGAAHPTAYTVYRAIDLNRPARPLTLTDLFPEADVLRALLSDPLVKKALTGLKSRRPANIQELVRVLTSRPGPCEYGFSDDLLTRFAFYRLEGERVAVRLGLSHGCEVARGRLTQLGIQLPVPIALKLPLLRAQSRKAGFLMKDQERVGRQRVTTIPTDAAVPP